MQKTIWANPELGFLENNSSELLKQHLRENAVTTNGGTAMVMVDYKFYGKPAHAAGNPWKGRSALDAVEALDYMVNLLREHVPTSSRIHYVIPDGGFAPNVVPEYSRVSSLQVSELQHLFPAVLVTAGRTLPPMVPPLVQRDC